MRTTIIVLLSFAPLAAQIINLGRVAERADAVAVGHVSDVTTQPTGAVFRLAVLRSLHGNLPTGEVLDITARFRSGRGANPGYGVTGRCALVLLARGSGGWEALGSRNSPFLSEFLIALEGCDQTPPVIAEGASVFEKCFAEVALSAARTSRTDAIPDLFSLAGISDSPLIFGIMRQLSASTETRLRTQGLAWRVRRGDAGALVELSELVLSTSEADKLGSFSAAVRDYTNTDATGVAALGRLVSQLGARDQYLKRGAAHALRNIHTRESIPFLAAMLDSPDPRIRMEAVSGLTEHVMGVRAVSDGPQKHEALDEVFNPARRKNPLYAVDPQFLHMGVFANKEEEARIVSYWREWWQANRTLFAAP